VTEGLNADGVGLQIEKGYVRVDAQYKTNIPGISAIGDVITLGTPGHPQLAHVSSAEGILTAERIAGQDLRPLNYEHVPGCTFCDPEIGSVGLTAQEAKARGFDVRIARFRSRPRARQDGGETDGFVKIVPIKIRRGPRRARDRSPLDGAGVAEATVALRLESTVEG
jgi:dihydrolipoamide dehydrogenase